MSGNCNSNECLWSEMGRFCDVLQNADVPLDDKWPLIILYLRGVGNLHFLSEVQKSTLQEILLALMQQKDFTSEKYAQIQSEIFDVITATLRGKLTEFERETAALAHDISDMFGKHRSDVARAAGAIEKDLARGRAPAVVLANLRGTLKSIIMQMEQDACRLNDLSKNDALTGLANRRSFDAYMEESADIWERDKTPLGLILFDIDEFKNFNDTYGHLVGDQVLRTLASQVQKVARSLQSCTTNVLAARYGGEEFALVLRGEAASRVGPIAENLRRVIQKTSLLLRDVDNNVLRSGVRVTVSLGAASMQEAWSGALINNLVDAADKALYTAKRNGRNCTVLHDQDGESSYTFIGRG